MSKMTFESKVSSLPCKKSTRNHPKMRRKSARNKTKSPAKVDSPEPSRRSTRSSRRLNKSPSESEEPENVSLEIVENVTDVSQISIETDDSKCDESSVKETEEVKEIIEEDGREDDAKGKSKGIVNSNDEQSWNIVESQIEHDNVQGTTVQSPSNDTQIEQKSNDIQTTNEDNNENVEAKQELEIKTELEQSFESKYVEEVKENETEIYEINNDHVDKAQSVNDEGEKVKDTEKTERKRITLRRSTPEENEVVDNNKEIVPENNRKIILKQQVKEEQVTNSNVEEKREEIVNEENEISEKDHPETVPVESQDQQQPDKTENDENEKRERRLSSVTSQDDEEEFKAPPRKIKLKRPNFDDEEQEEEKPVGEDQPKQRRLSWNRTDWLSNLSSSLYTIDVDSIKILCPNLDFLKEDEINLEHKPKERTKSEGEAKIFTENSDEDNEKHSSEESSGEQHTKNIIAMNRRISIVDDSAGKLKPPPSPAKNPKSEVLFITNLVRPYTVKQLKELLERTGTIREDGFWTDRIKSKCYAHYMSVEEAEETRNALHGINWPPGNGKQLIIDFATPEDLENAKNPPPPPPQPVIPPVVTETAPEKENREPEKAPFRHAEREHEERRRRSPSRELEQKREEARRRSRSRSRSRERVRKHSRRSYTPESHAPKKVKKELPPKPQKLMDDLFSKTKATPSIYWQPLSPEEIATKQKQRLVRMEEHKRRIEDRERRIRESRRPPFRRR